MNEIELIDETIDLLSQLDEYFERLNDNNIEKINIYIKIKELIFWLTYYKEQVGESED